MEFHGIEKQDEFAWSLLHNINNGFFVDIGCAHPIAGSNTHVFYKYKNWTGIAVDFALSQPWCGNFDWHIHRPNIPFLNMDARSPVVMDIIKQCIPDNHMVDYLTVDVDGNECGQHIQYGDIVIHNFIDAGFSFKVLTLEHEYYLVGDKVRQPTRDLLESLGYEMLFSDVCHPVSREQLTIHTNPPNSSEDWWINPKYFKDDILNYGGSWMLWPECIDKIRDYSIE